MQPEDAAYFEKTLELGKELASDLLDTDVLGRWMAHYISELIVNGEAATGGSAESIRRETAETIIELWNHRADIPAHHRPLSDFNPVFKALERLSEPQDMWGFYGMFDDGGEPGEAELSALPLLRYALDLEDVVRDLVRQIIMLAAAKASDREAKWVKLAEHLATDDSSRAIKELLKLAHKYSGEESRPTAGATSAQHEGEGLVDALRRAEEEMRHVRRGLEHALAGAAETDREEA
jgi:hypothetical protein